MSMRFNTPVFRPQDNKGRTLPGAQLFFFENYSTTPKTTYANVALTNPNPHPIIADGAGKFTDIFLGIGDYRVILTDRKGQILWDRNDVSTNDLTEDVINDIERQLNEVLNQYRMQYLGEYGVADPDLEKTFTVPNAQYVEFNGFAYWTVPGTTLPYTTDSVTYPDPATDPNLTIAPNVTFAYVDTVTNLGDSQLAGGAIWPLSSQDSLPLGAQSSNVNIGVSRLRVNTGSKVELLYLDRRSGDFDLSAQTITSIVSVGNGSYTVVTNLDSYTFIASTSGMEVRPLGDDTNLRSIASHLGDVVNARDYMLASQMYVDDAAVNRAIGALDGAPGFVFIPDTFDGAGNVVELSFTNSVNIYPGQYVFGGSRFGTRIRRTGSDVANIVVNLADAPGGTFTYDKRSTFNIIAGDNTQARNVGISNMQIIGDQDPDSIGIHTAWCAYSSVQNVDATSYENFWLSEYTSFFCSFDFVRANVCGIQWLVASGVHFTFRECYANGALPGRSGRGFQLNNCANTFFFNTAADTIAEAFYLTGTTDATFSCSGVEARLYQIRTLDEAKAYVYGGRWSMTAIGSQATSDASLFRAEDNSRIKVKNADCFIFDFTSGAIDRSKKKLGWAFDNAQILIEDTDTEDDPSSDKLPLDPMGDDLTAVGNAKVKYISRGEVLKSSNLEAKDIFTTGIFPEKQFRRLSKTQGGGTTPISIGQTATLAYGDGLSGRVDVRAFSTVDGGLTVHGTATIDFAFSFRNQENSSFNVVSNNITGFDSASASVTFATSFDNVNDKWSLSLTPDQANLGTLKIEADWSYISYNSGGLSKFIDVS